MHYLRFLLLIFYYGGCMASEDQELNRDKKDVSTIKNLASSVLGSKIKRYPLSGDSDWNYKNYPINNYPSGGGPGWSYHGNFGGSYVGTYERGTGGYTYDRPQGGNWIKPGFPTYDDSVVIYPVTGSAPKFPSTPSSPGIILPSSHTTYPTGFISSSYLPVPVSPPVYSVPLKPIVSSVNIGQSLPPRPVIPSISFTQQVPAIHTRPTISSVPLNQPLPIEPSGPGITSIATGPAFTQSFPVVPERPTGTSVIQQSFPPTSSGSIAHSLPIVPVKPVITSVHPPLSVSPIAPPPAVYGQPPPPFNINNVDTSFTGYNYDKPDIPFC